MRKSKSTVESSILNPTYLCEIAIKVNLMQSVGDFISSSSISGKEVESKNSQDKD